MALRRGAALAALLVATAACTGGPDEAPLGPTSPAIEADPDDDAPRAEPDPAGGATLRWAIGSPSAIVPPLAEDRDGQRVVDALFQSLTAVDDEGQARPALAEHWRSDGRGTVWTFRLRADARFHDGSEVTADDVRFSWEEGVRQGRVAPHLEDVAGFAALAAGEAERLAGVEAVDDRTLQVVLDRPRADFPVLTAHPALAPVPARRYRADPQGFGEQPIGNGAFAMAEPWVEGSFLRLRPTDEEVVGVDEVLFREVDAATGYLAFRQDRVDVATVPHGALEEAIDRHGAGMDGREGTGVMNAPAPEVLLLGVDHEAPPLDDVGVRRALAMALDRAELVAVMPDANASPGRAVSTSALPGGQSWTCAACVHAPATAEALFAEAGVDALTVHLLEDDAGLAGWMARDLAEVGVDLEVVTLPFDEHAEAVASGEANVFRYGWRAEHPTVSDVVVPLLHSRSTGHASGNPGGYADADVDALIDEALATPEDAERLALLRQAERRGVGQDLAVVPLAVLHHRLVVAERVAGFALGPTGRVDLAEVRIDAR